MGKVGFLPQIVSPQNYPKQKVQLNCLVNVIKWVGRYIINKAMHWFWDWSGVKIESVDPNADFGSACCFVGWPGMWIHSRDRWSVKPQLR